MSKVFQARQGDVLVVAVKSIPLADDIKRDKGRIVLAYGEVTGHAHAIEASLDMARFVINKATQRRYLDLKGLATLRHDEHAEIQLPAGQYEVIQQQEYNPREWRKVAD